jgi:hypothetical protein
MNKDIWTKNQVPEWVGKKPEIHYGFRRGYYIAEIVWNGRLLECISYARENAVHAEAKRKRIKYMKMILEGKI